MQFYPLGLTLRVTIAVFYDPTVLTFWKLLPVKLSKRIFYQLTFGMEPRECSLCRGATNIQFAPYAL